MRQTLGVLGFVICLNMTTNSMAAPAADAGEQDFAKGESLLKHKQYAEARATLEAGLIKNSSNVQAHFNLAEACRGLAAWDCAEEHYETALHLDAKSRITGTRELRLSKMKVWQSLEEVTAWRLLEEAKGLLAGGQVQPDKMKQAEEALEGAHELGLNNEQQAVYQQLQAKFTGRRSTTSPHSLKPDGSGGEAFPTDPATYQWRWCRQGNSGWGARWLTKSPCIASTSTPSPWTSTVTVGQYAKYLRRRARRRRSGRS